ncbi:MAG: type II toxin-antitoxin system VapC family toxin [Bryobacteraceae bacterium]
MILDSSAIVAIHLKEPGHDAIREKIRAAETVGIGAPTLLETAIVLTSRLGRDARPLLRLFLRTRDFEVIPFGASHVDAALAAFLKFGRGRHKAGLNFGDCQAYATASVANMPLLYVGNDFSQTDIESA